MCEDHPSRVLDSFVHEDEPPFKKSRMCHPQNKRALTSDEHTAAPVDEQVSTSPAVQAIDADSLWHEASGWHTGSLHELVTSNVK